MRLSSVHALGVTFIYVVRDISFWGSSNQRHLGRPPKFNMEPEINPWKRTFGSWKPSLLSGFTLNFGGCSFLCTPKMPDTCTSKPVLVFHTHHLKMAALSTTWGFETTPISSMVTRDRPYSIRKVREESCWFLLEGKLENLVLASTKGFEIL